MLNQNGSVELLSKRNRRVIDSDGCFRRKCRRTQLKQEATALFEVGTSFFSKENPKMKSNNLRACVVLALAVFALVAADSVDAKLFGRLRGGDCCCETTCCESGGFLSGLRGHFKSDDCCCEPVCCEPVCCEPAPACGCEAPVVEDCGCEAAPVVEDCGCAAAPVVEDCGCEAPVVEECGCVEAAPCCEAEPCCESGHDLCGKLKGKLGGLRGRFAGDSCGCGC